MPDEGLAARVRAAAAVLLPGESAGETGALLEALVRDAQQTRSLDRLWLLMSCVSTVLPDAEQLRAMSRVLRTATAGQAVVQLLDEALPYAVLSGPTRLRVVTGGVLVLVDHSARHDLQTGIQRVVRAVLPRWVRDHDVLPVAHTVEYGGMRTLAPDELERVIDWRPERAARDGEPTSAFDPSAWEVVVPWRSTVVLAEVPHLQSCPRFAALAESSGNVVTAIGYDCIPVVSSGIVSPGQAEKFAGYLAVIKHARRVAAISESAAGEFSGFVEMLPSQGLTGPVVTACVLPSDMGSALEATPVPVAAPRPGRPLVLCVGRLDARKNQVALLHAAEQLWREGLDFRLALVAGGGFGREGKRAVRRLRLRRRPVTLAQAISDEDLRAAYLRARFTVFASLHEGYGLPVAESFALGVPALTTSYGSTREIAADGGALLVDPRDDDALREALRRMLTDDALLDRLRAEIAARSRRTWDDYAGELWEALVHAVAPAESR